MDTDTWIDLHHNVLPGNLLILAIQQQRYRVHVDENRRERLDVANAK